ncbi:MAG: methyltransferase domain-containing protein [SAR324 cluster bacterium]|nr:methyltransferase domain-containing protein [SAR324 cluster bacterium]
MAYLKTLQRITSLRDSQTDPDYTLFKGIREFIEPFKTKKWNSILDFGAGNLPYKSLFDHNHYIAVDVEQNEDRTIDIIIIPNSNLPIQADSIDLILCMDVLEHCENINIVLGELHRVLNIGGTLLMSVPFMYREHEMPYDFARYTSSALTHLLKSHGFKNIELSKCGNYYFTLYSLWNESIIKSGETLKQLGIFQKIIRKFITLILPLLNRTIFSTPPSFDDSIYHHILISAKK